MLESLAVQRQFPLIVVNVTKNLEMANQWAVKKIPAIFLQHRSSGTIRIVGYGLLAMDTIEERMCAA